MSFFSKDASLEEMNRRWLPALERSLGVRLTSVSEGELRAEYTVTDLLLQPFGIMHGGMHCVIAESLGSIGAAMTAMAAKEGTTAVGQGLNANYFRPAKLGTVIEAIARPKHVGGRSQVWEIQMLEKGSGKSLASCTLTLAVVEIAGLSKGAKDA